MSIYIGQNHQQLNTSVVYWIHSKKHTDIFNQGYVGITNQPARKRWLDHQSAARIDVKGHCDILNRAIRKHEDLIYEVVLVADSREYCERIEGLLRPHNKIGWNIARGGMPVDTAMGGLANRYRWIKHWIDNPTKAADRWWKTEQTLLNKQALSIRLANKPAPFTKQRKHHSKNTSGYAGVSWYKPLQKWKAAIGLSPKVVSLGSYDNPEEAHVVYLKAKVIHAEWRRNNLSIEQAINQIKALRPAK